MVVNLSTLKKPITKIENRRTMINWRKLGLLISPADGADWMKTHAMLPCIQPLGGDLYKVYFSSRDEKNRSLVGYANLEITERPRIHEYSPDPVLGLGELGCFDDNGVTPSWVLEHKGKVYLYYIGWNQRSTVRMALVAGVAVSTDGGDSFERVYRVPILDRTHEEPLTLNTAPCVLREGNRWKMWYVSGVTWINPDLPRYNIKYAESNDGLRWDRRGITCIDFESTRENALARPCVLQEDGIYKMWFSHKGEEYRIGYAESADGIAWDRKDDVVGIDVSSSGWDSQMIEYAYVFNHAGNKYMLYNGNNYGEEGIGLAVAR